MTLVFSSMTTRYKLSVMIGSTQHEGIKGFNTCICLANNSLTDIHGDTNTTYAHVYAQTHANTDKAHFILKYD